MKMVELTDVATNATGSVNLDEVPSMEEVPGPAGTTVTRLTFRGGHQIDVYETIAEIMQLAHLQRAPLRSRYNKVVVSGCPCVRGSFSLQQAHSPNRERPLPPMALVKNGESSAHHQLPTSCTIQLKKQAPRLKRAVQRFADNANVV